MSYYRSTSTPPYQPTPQDNRRSELLTLLMRDARLTPPSPSRSRSQRRRRSLVDPDTLSYLTDDGKHVVQKRTTHVFGHESLISVRTDAHEVDPVLLCRLKAERDERLERAERKQRKLRGEITVPLLEERLNEARVRYRQDIEVAERLRRLSVHDYPVHDSYPMSIDDDKGKGKERQVLGSENVRRTPVRDVHPSLRRSKRGVHIERSIEGEGEDLDVWQRLADEYGKGQSPLRRASQRYY